MKLYILLAGFIIGILVGLSGWCPFWHAAGVVAVVVAGAVGTEAFLSRGGSVERVVKWRWLRTPAYALCAFSFGLIVTLCHPDTPVGPEADFQRWVEHGNPSQIVRISVVGKGTGEYGDYARGCVESPLEWKNNRVWIFSVPSAARTGTKLEMPLRILRKGSPRKGTEIRVVADAGPEGASAIREKGAAWLSTTGLNPRTRGLLRVLFFGDSSGLDYESRKAMADTGLSHLLALSGMHVGIVASIAFFLLYPIRFFGYRRLHLAAGLVVVWLFVIMTWSPSTLRAGIMMSVAITAISLGRRSRAGNSLAIAAFVILLISPSALSDPGFQFSFLAVAAIVAFGERLNPIDIRRHYRLRKIIGAVNVSLIVSFVSWVVTAWYFGRIPLAFLPFNLVAVPLLGPYVIGALAYCGWILGFGTTEGVGWLGELLDKLLGNLVKLATLTGDGTVLEFRPELWMVWGWLVIVALVGLILNRHGEIPD